jgi:DNA polymerase phi
VLETKETSPGTQDLFDVDESADETMECPDGVQRNGQLSSSRESDAEMLDSDVEEVSEKSSSLEEQADEEAEDDQAELEDFDAKLAAALGTRKGQDDLAAEDTEGSDEDMYEEDMDEDEMEALDEKLAEVFRASKPATNKKQERKGTKEAIINFKRRVLDLIEVYLKQEYLNPFALDLVLPLIRTSRTTNTKQISERAHDILQGFCSKCKGSNVPIIDDGEAATSGVLGCLKAVHIEAGLDNSRAHTSTCSRASILLVKVLVKAQVDVREMVDVYAETRKRQLLDLSCTVQPIFFTEWNNWCISARDQLAK